MQERGLSHIPLHLSQRVLKMDPERLRYCLSYFNRILNSATQASANGRVRQHAIKMTISRPT